MWWAVGSSSAADCKILYQKNDDDDDDHEKFLKGAEGTQKTALYFRQEGNIVAHSRGKQSSRWGFNWCSRAGGDVPRTQRKSWKGEMSHKWSSSEVSSRSRWEAKKKNVSISS